MDETKAVKNISSRRLFAPYFKSRWQNLQNIVNDSIFYSMIKEPFLSYYQAYIRQWSQWATGFVTMLHRRDFFSTGMGYTVCDIFSTECVKGGFRFDSGDQKYKAFLEEWQEQNEAEDVFSESFFYANASGNSILCLTPINAELSLSVIPVNRCIFRVSNSKTITSALILTRFISGSETYNVKENREMLNGKPFYKVNLSSGGGTAVSPSWNGAYLENVPNSIKSQWECSYGDIKPNKWYSLPKIKTLGLYNVKNKSMSAALSGLNGYSDSTLHTALDILYSIDYNYTQGQLDQYWGRTRVLTPKAFQTITATTANAVLVGNATSFVEAVEPPLDDEIYSEIPNPNMDGKPFQPTFIQPDIRGEIRKYIRDSDLELLASKVGLSSSTLANHLTYNNSKTATEVNAEQDTTDDSVSKKRMLASRAINAMLKDLALFYGFSASAKIIWNQGNINSAAKNKALLEDYNAGTLPLKEYLKRRWPDVLDEELDVWIAQLKSAQKEKLSQEIGNAYFNRDDYFSGVEGIESG